MSSQRRIDASRANGSLSCGPKTDSGKARSSLNGIKHGDYAKSILLPNESAARFNKLSADYSRALQPTNEIERDLIQELIVCRWFTRRARALESTSVTYKMDEQKDQVEARDTRLPERFRTAITHKNQYDSGHALPYIQRSQARNLSLFHKALSHLYGIRCAPKSENEQSNLVPNSDTPRRSPQRALDRLLQKARVFSNARPLRSFNSLDPAQHTQKTITAGNLEGIIVFKGHLARLEPAHGPVRQPVPPWIESPSWGHPFSEPCASGPGTPRAI